MSLKYRWKYLKLGDFAYNILPQDQIKPFLMEWLMHEWESDHTQFPDQPWTLEWLNLLPWMDFTLETLGLEEIKLRKELMSYKRGGYDFLAQVQKRAGERKQSVQRGVSTGPVIVNGNNNELMDGYTRYVLLEKYHQNKVYAYVGRVW